MWKYFVNDILDDYDDDGDDDGVKDDNDKCSKCNQ